MSKTETNYKISNWLGEFSDRATEQAFRDYYTDTAARYLRIALLVWAGILLMFALPDYFAHGSSPAFYQLLTMRVASVTMLAFVYVYSYKKPQIATTGYVVTAAEIAAFSGFFMLYFLSVEFIVWTIGVTQIMLLTLYIFIPNRVYLASIAAVYAIVGSVASVGMVVDTTVESQISLAFLFILPSIVGFAVALRLQIAQREHYALISTANTVNQQLEREISRREQLESELQHQATTDPLTGLFNRREYERLFKLERERAKRTGRPFCLCLADLDHFKAVNDRFGHDVGDKVLIHIADLLRQTLRQTDIIGRFGGEEFILLLPETDLEKALELTNRLRESIASTPLLCDSEIIQMTATFGVALVQETDKNINEVIRRTDEALYKGKHEGRNRVMRAA